MTNKSKFFAELKKQHNIKKFKVNSKNTKLAKTHKVALALLDNFVWDDVNGLEEEVSRLSYSTEEWYDEKFDQFIEARGVLRDVYINNSEAFLTTSDVAGDEEILNTLVEKADELGIPVTTLYPDYDRHLQLIKDFEYLDKRFDEQKAELESYGV
jgi:hypothetical protein